MAAFRPTTRCIEMQIDFEAVMKWVVLAIGAFFAWFARRLHSKIDGAVSRKELKDFVDTVRIEQVRMHEENVKRQDHMTARIDALYERFVK